MQLSNTSLKNGILQREEVLCNLGDGALTASSTEGVVLTKQFIGLSNESYFEIWMAQMSVDKNSRSDDYNYTDYPDAPITMVLNQADYTLPVAVTSANVATFLRLKGIYFKLNGERIYLRPMEEGETRSDTSGEPVAYQLNGKSIFFNCPLDAATLTKYSSLFYVEFQRVPDAFAYADLDGSKDSSQQPGFMETYHDLIPLRTSAKYLLPINPNLSAQYDQQFYARLELFKRDVARLDDNRNTTMRPRLTPHI